MQELQYLTENDLEYFKKLEEKGEAVIVHLDAEQLLALDPEKLWQSANENQQIDENKLIEWLKEHEEELHQRYEENQRVLLENQRIKRTLFRPEHKSKLSERLQEVDLDSQQMLVLSYAIRQGLNEDQILLLLRDGLTLGEMQQLCDLIIKLQ